MPKTLKDYLDLPYRLEVTKGEHGGWVVRYPELVGCVTQVRRAEDIIPMAEEILSGWLEIALEDGQEIPLPQQRNDYSGKFLVRTTRTMHRELVETASDEGVSLNAYVNQLLTAQHTRAEVRRQLDDVCDKLDELSDRLPVSYSGIPKSKSLNGSILSGPSALAA